METLLRYAPLVGVVLCLVGYLPVLLLVRRWFSVSKAEAANHAKGIAGLISSEAAAEEANAKAIMASLRGLDTDGLRQELTKLSLGLQADIAAVHDSLAALDLPGVKQSVAALRIATGSAVADLHAAIADARSQPMSSGAAALHDKIDGLQRIVSDQKSQALITDAARAHAILAEAVREQAAHEETHPVKYDADQREHSLFLRAQRSYQTHRIAVPVNLRELVREAMKV